MKALLTVCLIACLAVSSRAQDMGAMKAHYMKIYNQGLAYNDVNTAIAGLQGYLALDSSVLYKDTLSMIYFSRKNYMSALILAEEVFKADAANIMAKARAAECYDELGDTKTAITLFEQVVPQTRNPYHLYKLAVCQYQLKRTGECESNARAALADTNSSKIGVMLANVDGSQQFVPINAASANLLGVLKMEQKDYAGAKADFENAVKMFPDFKVAQENLEVVKKSVKAPARTPAKTPTKPKG